MTNLGFDLKLRWRPVYRLHTVRQRMQIAREVLSKWIGPVLHQLETSAQHVEYHDAPSLDGMRWCDEVERKISQGSMSTSNWLDTRRDTGRRQTSR